MGGLFVKRKLKIMTVVVMVCVILMSSTIGVFAWSDLSSKKMPNGETLEARIWMQTGNFKFDAVTSAWLYDQQEKFDWFKNTMTITAVSMGLTTISMAGPGVTGSGTSCASCESISKTTYAGINKYGIAIGGVRLVNAYVKGESTATVQHGGQAYSYTEDCFKWDAI